MALPNKTGATEIMAERRIYNDALSSFVIYSALFGVHKNKNQFIQKHPLKTIPNRHASQRIPTEKTPAPTSRFRLFRSPETAT
ncbi:hypothetical protein OIU92_31430 [Escherichia coli]|nr:hypothetical protein [Escherichia coli]